MGSDVHYRLGEFIRKDHRLLVIILALGLVHGLAYLILVPPWEHYDEPTHFEYAWLIAHRPGLPGPGDFDQAMRREVAASMLESGFFRDRDIEINLDASTEPIWIGISQLNDPPLYYFLASIPLRLFPPYLQLTSQLYAARFASVILYLATLVAAYGFVRELVPERHSLRLLIPLTVALLPGLADLMTSVNSDVAAVTLFSFFLWASAALIRRGVSIRRLLWASTVVVLGIFSKITVLVALPLLAAALFFALTRRLARRTIWVVIVLSIVLLLLTAFSFDNAAFWFRPRSGLSAERISMDSAPVGKYVLRLDWNSDQNKPQLLQVLPNDIKAGLLGQTVTVGAWLWASEPIRISSPALAYDNQGITAPVEIGTEPEFHAISAELGVNSGTMRIELAPATSQNLDAPISVFVDGLILVEGAWPTEVYPEFDTVNGEQGTWGGRPFKNLARNASFERPTLRLRPWVEQAVDELIGDDFFGPPTVVFASLMDLRSAGQYYHSAAANLFRTFWAKFGWGQVNLIGRRPYQVLGLFTGVALVGAAFLLGDQLRKRLALPWEIYLFFGVSLIMIWGQALVRGAGSFDRNWIFIPAARYAYPVVIPTVAILTLGWYGWIRLLETLFGLRGWIMWVAFFGFFLALDAWSLLSIYIFFSSRGAA